MKKSIYLLLFLVGILEGCNNPKTNLNVVDDLFQDEQEKVLTVLNDIYNLAKTKDMDSLDTYHLNSPKFSKFGSSGGDRKDYEMAKSSEYESFSQVSEFNFTLSDTKVDVFDDTAIATFVIDYNVKVNDSTIYKMRRGTLAVGIKGEKCSCVIFHRPSSFTKTTCYMIRDTRILLLTI